VDRTAGAQVALFEDRQTDARMRRTIPQFALLGGVAVAATTPFAVPTPAGRLFVLGLAAAAALSAVVLRFRNVINRINHWALFGLLSTYCVLIALAVAATDSTETAYRFVFVVPVLFTATFFTGWPRYSLAVLAPAIEFAIAGRVLPIDLGDTAVRVVMFLFFAHFGAVVSSTLRESLRSANALHNVLEAASGAPFDSDLATIGLDAALDIVGWSHGAVLMPVGEEFRAAAMRVPAGVLERYDAAPRRMTDDSSVVEVVRTKRPMYINDLAAVRGPDHVLVAAGMRSTAVLPLTHHGEPIGVLLLADSHVRSLDDLTRDRLDRIASQLALALGSAAAFRTEIEASARLRELNRRKDEFLANVSHELRTPAATIKLVAATLRSAADRLRPDQLHDMYETLERRAEHLAALIESLLEQAVAEAGVVRLRLTNIDWRDAVVRWAEIAQLQSGRDITLHVPAGAVIGSGDTVKLERVVANLLSNAAKFSPPDTPIELSLRADGDMIEVFVRDQGVGIAADELDLIFDRFHQVEGGTTRSAGGFGIGLSLARHFVEAHGGTIDVQSTPGAGTTFTVRVPRSQPTPAAPDQPGVIRNATTS
jgi:signal transduction histidine kinase